MLTAREKNFVDVWLGCAIFHSNSAVIGRNDEPAFDWTLLCAKSVGIGQNCELSHNMCSLVNFVLNYPIAELWNPGGTE
jgi:invasion protein IalB